MCNDRLMRVLILCLGLGAVALISIGAHLHNRAVQNRKTKLVAAEQEWAQLDTLCAVCRHEQQEVAQLEQQLQRYRAAVPGEINLGQLLEEFGAELESVGATNRQSGTAEVERGDVFGRIPISIRFDGTFEAFHRILSATEAMDRMVHFQKLEVTREKLDEPNPLHIAMDLSVFSKTAEVSGP